MSAISVNNLTKKFKDFPAITDLSFEVPANHVVGFLGPNGAGKTTTLRVIVGLSKPTEGGVTVSDVPVVFGESTANAKIGYLPEQPAFYGWMTGDEYLRFIADLFPLAAKAQRVAEALKLVDLTGFRDKRVATYSSGMKQRLGIAQALLHDPEVLILDEPVSALDPIGRKEVLEIIEKLKAQKTILFSTHILADVDRICDDVVIINKGRLVAAAPLAELKAKYASPVLEVEFAADPRALLAAVRREPWVKRAESNGNLLRVWLNDDGAVGQNRPLKYFAEQKLGVLKYGLTLPGTEDLFVELLDETAKPGETAEPAKPAETEKTHE